MNQLKIQDCKVFTLYFRILDINSDSLEEVISENKLEEQVPEIESISDEINSILEICDFSKNINVGPTDNNALGNF